VGWVLFLTIWQRCVSVSNRNRILVCSWGVSCCGRTLCWFKLVSHGLYVLETVCDVWFTSLASKVKFSVVVCFTEFRLFTNFNWLSNSEQLSHHKWITVGFFFTHSLYGPWSYLTSSLNTKWYNNVNLMFVWPCIVDIM
jgi:hypothetical protein